MKSCFAGRTDGTWCGADDEVRIVRGCGREGGSAGRFRAMMGWGMTGRCNGWWVWGWSSDRVRIWVMVRSGMVDDSCVVVGICCGEWAFLEGVNAWDFGKGA